VTRLRWTKSITASGIVRLTAALPPLPEVHPGKPPRVAVSVDGVRPGRLVTRNGVPTVLPGRSPRVWCGTIQTDDVHPDGRPWARQRGGLPSERAAKRWVRASVVAMGLLGEGGR
jgi:hypothetical protein